MDLEIGKLVKCLETDRIGVVIDVRRSALAMVCRVKWGAGSQSWVEIDEVELIY